MNEKLFIENWLSKVQSSGTKQFPFHFIDETQLDKISIPIKNLTTIVGKNDIGKSTVL